ncbi:MAG: hypothetical protein HYR55_06710 [Acidobacteria bacterium]|nr:hypothetical protein [Acidobacteriota bacterium]MBI3658598.1 hypothetical protein [Acidobacteriota bacterium]
MSYFSNRKLSLKVVILVTVAALVTYASQDGPIDRVTGDFGEQNCTFCHSDFPVDSGRDQGGTFDILDVPPQYTPGQTYTIRVSLGQPLQKKWGFELAARFVEDGAQAGGITVTNLDQMQLSTDPDTGVQYLKQTYTGTFDGTLDGPVEWSFDWTAPDSGTVRFGAAGNAADGDNSRFGDYIYTTTQETSPAASARN